MNANERDEILEKHGFSVPKTEPCLRCGLPESHQKHDRRNPPPEGWHMFRGQDYLDALEDALLFARENNQPHQWVETGVVFAVNPPFAEKRCVVCGAINRGRKDDGICFGNHDAELGIIEAHNRRAVKSWQKERLKG